VAKRYADALTDDLYARLSGDAPDRHADQAILFCTVDADGRPRIAMLSYFELAARDRRTLHLAVYKDSRTCANVRRGGSATLVIVDAALACYVSGLTSVVESEMRAAPENVRARLHIDQVVFDEASPDVEPGVHITNGIVYSARTGDALAKAEAVLAELRQA
jgi:hypothetical protein